MRLQFFFFLSFSHFNRRIDNEMMNLENYSKIYLPMNDYSLVSPMMIIIGFCLVIDLDYSCAWQKDILAQGRMYLSANNLCFYANILNWKSILCLKFEEIVCITREKTAKVISNAIEVKTIRGERYFFASFVTRDKTYMIIDRLWKSVHSNQVIPFLPFFISSNSSSLAHLSSTAMDDYS